jgi:hypothetical protein
VWQCSHVFALLIERAVSGTMGDALVRRRTARKVQELENHHMICREKTVAS